MTAFGQPRATSSTHTVLVVRPDGFYALVSINGPRMVEGDQPPNWLAWLYSLIRTDVVERVQLLDAIDCWIDEEAFVAKAGTKIETNVFATRMLPHLTVQPPTILAGTVVFTGRGAQDVTGLTQDQIQAVAAAYRRVEREMSGL